MKVKKMILSAILMIAAMGCFTGCIVNFDPDRFPSYNEEINNSSFEYKLGNNSWTQVGAPVKKLADNNYYIIYDEYRLTSNKTLIRKYYICTTKVLSNGDFDIKERKYYINVYYDYSATRASEDYFHVHLQPILTETKLPPFLVNNSKIENLLTSTITKHFDFKNNSKLEIDNIEYK